MRKLNKIIIHCSATPENREHNAKDMDRWHKKRGFREIGYHYFIKLDGTIEEGRALSKQGAHCSGQNRGSIGIAYCGGMSEDMKKAKDTRTPAQKESLINLMRSLIYKYNKDMTIHSHRDYANKACPSFDATNEYKHL